MLEFTEQRVFTTREGFVNYIEWSPDGSRLLESRPNKGIVRVWDVESGDEVFVLRDGPYASSAWSPSGDAIALVTSDRAVCVVNLDGSLSERWTFAPEEKCWRVAWAPHGKSVVVGSWHDTVWFLDAATGEVKSTKCLAIGERGLYHFGLVTQWL